MIQGHQPRRQQQEQQPQQQQPPRLERPSLATPAAVPPPPPPPLPPPPPVHTVEPLQLTPAPSSLHNNGAMCGKPTAGRGAPVGMVKVSMSPEGRQEERGRYAAAAAAPPPEAMYRGGVPEPPRYLIPPPGEQPAAVLDKTRQWGPQKPPYGDPVVAAWSRTDVSFLNARVAAGHHPIPRNHGGVAGAGGSGHARPPPLAPAALAGQIRRHVHDMASLLNAYRTHGMSMSLVDMEKLEDNLTGAAAMLVDLQHDINVAVSGASGPAGAPLPTRGILPGANSHPNYSESQQQGCGLGPGPFPAEAPPFTAVVPGVVNARAAISPMVPPGVGDSTGGGGGGVLPGRMPGTAGTLARGAVAPHERDLDRENGMTQGAGAAVEPQMGIDARAAMGGHGSMSSGTGVEHHRRMAFPGGAPVSCLPRDVDAPETSCEQAKNDAAYANQQTKGTTRHFFPAGDGLPHEGAQATYFSPVRKKKRRGKRGARKNKKKAQAEAYAMALLSPGLLDSEDSDVPPSQRQQKQQQQQQQQQRPSLQQQQQSLIRPPPLHIAGGDPGFPVFISPQDPATAKNIKNYSEFDVFTPPRRVGSTSEDEPGTKTGSLKEQQQKVQTVTPGEHNNDPTTFPTGNTTGDNNNNSNINNPASFWRHAGIGSKPSATGSNSKTTVNDSDSNNNNNNRRPLQQQHQRQQTTEHATPPAGAAAAAAVTPSLTRGIKTVGQLRILAKVIGADDPTPRAAPFQPPPSPADFSSRGERVVPPPAAAGGGGKAGGAVVVDLGSTVRYGDDEIFGGTAAAAAAAATGAISRRRSADAGRGSGDENTKKVVRDDATASEGAGQTTTTSAVSGGPAATAVAPPVEGSAVRAPGAGGRDVSAAALAAVTPPEDPVHPAALRGAAGIDGGVRCRTAAVGLAAISVGTAESASAVAAPAAAGGGGTAVKEGTTGGGAPLSGELVDTEFRKRLEDPQKKGNLVKHPTFVGDARKHLSARFAEPETGREYAPGPVMPPMRRAHSVSETLALGFNSSSTNSPPLSRELGSPLFECIKLMQDSK